MSDSVIRVESISHGYGNLAVLETISFEVRHGEILAIVGPSGCGKTTLLRIIGGGMSPSKGNVHRQGRVRTVRQRSGLLPWRTVAQNIELGLRNGHDNVGPDAMQTQSYERMTPQDPLPHRTPSQTPLPLGERGQDEGEVRKSRKDSELRELLRLFRLERFADFYPHQISGGMRQRAEVGRALAGASEILLLDEPFSSLDYLTRLRLRGELVELLRVRPRTVVLVTHDVTEAAQLADRVLVLSDRPAAVRREIRIDSMRPREPTSPEVTRVAHEILSELGLEHGTRPHDADSTMPMI